LLKLLQFTRLSNHLLLKAKDFILGQNACHYGCFANTFAFTWIIFRETACWLLLFSFTYSTKAASKAGYFEGLPLFKCFKLDHVFINYSFLDIQSWTCLVSMLNLAAIAFLLWPFSWYIITASFFLTFQTLCNFSDTLAWLVLLFAHEVIFILW